MSNLLGRLASTVPAPVEGGGGGGGSGRGGGGGGGACGEWAVPGPEDEEAPDDAAAAEDDGLPLPPLGLAVLLLGLGNVTGAAV